MLRDQQWHHIIVRLQRAMSLLGPFSPVPWLVQIGFRLAPSIWKLRDWREMVHWCEQQMRSRLLDEKPMQTYHDLAYYLVEAEGEEITDEDLFWLHGDSLLAIVAGSEPTAYALILLFCELAKHPDHIDKLYEELVNLNVTDLNPTILQILSKLPHLNAVINECLRLYPALLTGGARKTLDKGIVVGDTFIPPHTTIVAPRYTISRREDCFHHGNEFIPERWTTSPQMVRNAAAFTPFGTGHHSCLGRGLALDTIRLVTAKLVKKYHFRLAPGENGLGVFSDMKDQFTANPGHLEICFELRKGD
ncbi:hypothetical protein NUW58_g6315 [Xylaria curta]|uniref:Uncharacterized protein n=1 Tax=Xylaria curta TaxID=42375 RepID=A0ACC1NUR5_9PEZI|nr:hypothetical protein NUW58_g6315 [Xylaria curta]